MPAIIPETRNFVRFSKGGLLIREVPGDKEKSHPHKPDRRVEVNTEGRWVAPSLYHQALFLYLYALNEDGLYPPVQGFAGGAMVWKMMADVPVIGPSAAYVKWVDKPRRRRQ
jgi:hypothetical protein